jgi:hypothetical protein
VTEAADTSALAYYQGRLMGLRTNRYSWWVHWRELADYILPRRYKWLITPNQQMRGSPLNQHILDSTGTLAARNLSSGMMSGISSPTRPWLRLRIKGIDSTQPGPIALWLADVERLLMAIFQASNFYNSIAQLYFDLVVFGTGVMIIYEDYENVIHCKNPCAGEYYLDVDGSLRPTIYYEEFIYTTAQAVNEFGIDNVSKPIRDLYEGRDGSGRTKELIIAHAIEPNDAPHHSVDKRWPWREVFWEWGGSASQQGGTSVKGFLRKKGYHEQPNIAVRWDLVSNDPYGRSPGMDALPDIKQLQLESRRKAQGIDKGVNPPMVADIQLKNQPASMLPGGFTYVSGFTQTGHPGVAPIYGNWKPDIAAIKEDLDEVRDRIRKVFFNDILQTMQSLRAQTSSNVTATEIDTTKAESLIMLGPVLERIYNEGLKKMVDRTFAIASRAGILPPAPQELRAGQNIDIEFISMLAVAQQAAATSGIERLLQVAGNLAAIDPSTMDNVNIDFTLEKMSYLLNNDPRIIRSPTELAAIRQQRAQQAQQQQQAEMAEKMAAGAKTLSETDVGGGENALQRMTGLG